MEPEHDVGGSTAGNWHAVAHNRGGQCHGREDAVFLGSDGVSASATTSTCGAASRHAADRRQLMQERPSTARSPPPTCSSAARSTAHRPARGREIRRAPLPEQVANPPGRIPRVSRFLAAQEPSGPVYYWRPCCWC
jgi:hypothetical protein